MSNDQVLDNDDNLLHFDSNKQEETKEKSDMPIENLSIANRTPIFGTNKISESAIYSNQFNELISSDLYQISNEIEQRSLISNFIHSYVEKYSKLKNAADITVIIANQDLYQLKKEVSSLNLLKKTIEAAKELYRQQKDEGIDKSELLINKDYFCDIKMTNFFQF